MSMWGSLFIEYDFSKGQEKVFSIPFFPLVILFFWKNQLFLYWSLKIGFPLSIILITLISWSFSSTFMGNLSSVFFTSLIWFFCSISLSSPPWIFKYILTSYNSCITTLFISSCFLFLLGYSLAIDFCSCFMKFVCPWILWSHALLLGL